MWCQSIQALALMCQSHEHSLVANPDQALTVEQRLGRRPQAKGVDSAELETTAPIRAKLWSVAIHMSHESWGVKHARIICHASEKAILLNLDSADTQSNLDGDLLRPWVTAHVIRQCRRRLRRR